MIGSPSTGQSQIDFKVAVYTQKIAELTAAKAIIDAATSRFTDLMAKSAGFWAGPAAVLVRAAYEMLKNRLKKLSEAIQNNIDALNKTIALMISTETMANQHGQTIKGAVESLSF